AATGLPLRVQVLAVDSASPAVDVGFTDLNLATPADSNFTFTAPPGATVREVTSPDELLQGADPGGHQWSGHRDGGGHQGDTPAPPPAPDGAPPVRPRVLGTGWDSVVALGQAPAALAALGRPVSGPWGSGHLVTTTLVDALVLDDGTTLVGLVRPERLQAAAAELRGGS
ncbi:MAG: hypothetical protein LC792_00500, partial [Actinobacteria bacterium]|nr:hypothetical protein [Actinomycetota bacterium]